MNILVVGFDLNEADREQAMKMMTACRFGMHQIEIKDIKTAAIDFTDKDYLIILGERASRSLIPMAKEKGLIYLQIPTIKNLYPHEQGGNSMDRIQTFSQLCSLSDTLKTGRLQLVEDRRLLTNMKLPAVMADLTIPVIQALEKMIVESGRTSWTCTTKDGKVVGITTDTKQPPPEGVDFCITFAELLLMRAAIDILKVQEIKFVPTSKLQTGQNS